MRKILKDWFKKWLYRAAGNRFTQRLLERQIRSLGYMMGIGTGSGFDTSGEEGLFRALRGRSSGPYCIFDVGANTGQFLDLACHEMGADSFTVHSFEPGSEAYRQLSLSPHQGSHVRLNRLALGREKGEVTLHYDNPGSALASLTKRKLDHIGIAFEGSETVPMDTVDGYCAQHGIARVHLLKMDVEGHELDVLAGARRMFEARAIDLATFEFGGCNIDTRTYFRDYWHFFTPLGYKLYRITPPGYLHPIDKYTELHEQFRAVNFVAMVS